MTRGRQSGPAVCLRDHTAANAIIDGARRLVKLGPSARGAWTVLLSSLLIIVLDHDQEVAYVRVISIIIYDKKK